MEETKEFKVTLELKRIDPDSVEFGLDATTGDACEVATALILGLAQVLGINEEDIAKKVLTPSTEYYDEYDHKVDDKDTEVALPNNFISQLDAILKGAGEDIPQTSLKDSGKTEDLDLKKLYDKLDSLLDECSKKMKGDE